MGALDHAVDLGFDQMRGATRGQQRRDSARPDDVADLLEPEIFTHAERRADAPVEPGVGAADPRLLAVARGGDLPEAIGHAIETGAGALLFGASARGRAHGPALMLATAGELGDARLFFSRLERAVGVLVEPERGGRRVAPSDDPAPQAALLVDRQRVRQGSLVVIEDDRRRGVVDADAVEE